MTPAKISELSAIMGLPSAPVDTDAAQDDAQSDLIRAVSMPDGNHS